MRTASSCRRIGTTAERPGCASSGIQAGALEGFERYRLLSPTKHNGDYNTGGMDTCKGYLLLALSAMLISEAWGGDKTVNGLSFQLSPPPKAPCLFQPFHVWQEPNPFFKNLKQVKGKQSLQYRRGDDIIANFSDSMTIRVWFWKGVSVSAFNSCSALPAFNPARIKFQAEWKNDSQTVPAKGNFVQSEQASPQTWCEDKCVDGWIYELRIDSENVPLRDDLVIRIEAQDGTRLAEYVGKLTTDRKQSGIAPSNLGISEE